MKNEATTNALEATVASLANKATYTGAGVAISGGILISEIAVIVGMVIGVLGLLVNWYYRAKDDRRAVIEHKRRMGERE